MSDMTDTDVLKPTIRTSQIIVAAMIMGVLTFLAITLFVTFVVGIPQGALAVEGPGNSTLPVITYIAVAVGLIDLALSFVIPGRNADRARRQLALEGKGATTKGGPSEAKQPDPAGNTGKLAQIFQTQLIIGAAMLEGGAFFALVAYLLEGSPLALATAIVLLGTLAARFPTSNRVNAWLDRQLGLLQEEGQSAI